MLTGQVAAWIAAVVLLQRAVSSLGVIVHAEGGGYCRRRRCLLLAHLVPVATACYRFLRWPLHASLPPYEQLLITAVAGAVPKWW
jgi:hypothetical protein